MAARLGRVGVAGRLWAALIMSRSDSGCQLARAAVATVWGLGYRV